MNALKMKWRLLVVSHLWMLKKVTQLFPKIHQISVAKKHPISFIPQKSIKKSFIVNLKLIIKVYAQLEMTGYSK